MAAAVAGAHTPTKNGTAASEPSPAIIAGAISVHDVANARTKKAAVGWAEMRVRRVVVMEAIVAGSEPGDIRSGPQTAMGNYGP